jgi:hypothetical protein
MERPFSISTKKELDSPPHLADSGFVKTGMLFIGDPEDRHAVERTVRATALSSPRSPVY